MDTFAWSDPTANTDGSALAAGEITGYQIGIGTAAGNYTILCPAVASSAVSETLAATGELLTPGTYHVAVRAVTASAQSAWSNDGTFVVAVPVPNAPTGFTVS